ncbi:MAG: hypothetical protein ACE5GY_02705 [Thermodesulfobacteriota bacterium]
MKYRRFSDCSVSERLLQTLFIVLLGTGYLFAMVLIFVSVAPLDGKPGLSAEDIVYKYSGHRDGTRLEMALKGSMRGHATDDERARIVSWIYTGAPRAAFESDVMPILVRRCAGCHARGSGLPEFTGYEKVMETVELDTGESFGTLARVSHIHLFGTSIVFYLLGRIFILTELPPWLKRTVVVVPFAAIAMDIGSWWFTRYAAGVFAYIVIIGGALMGLSFAFQSIVSLYQIWFHRVEGR